MKAFVAFFKKEVLENLRTGKLLILAALFVAFGIMNPAIAKLTPWMMDLFAEDLAESGMTITAVEVDAMTSWTQFFKNIPMALLAFVFLYAGAFTKEYQTKTLILILTKGMARHKVVLAKSALMLSLWTLGFWLCFGITYAYNAYFWDNSVAHSLLASVIYWWLFGVLVISLMILFSILTRNYSGVLLGTGGSVLACYLLSLIPKLTDYIPTTLMSGMALLMDAKEAKDFLVAAILAALASVACIASSILIFNKKEL
jgi:ABC-2 type transport system permease protein